MPHSWAAPVTSQRRRMVVVRILRAVVVPAMAALLGTPAGVATAELLPLPDVEQTKTTADQWQLRLALTGMTVNAVPSLDATRFTQEAFVSGTATVTIDGGGTAAVNTGALVLGAQIGCHIDLSDGLDLGIGNSYDAVGNSPYLNFSPNVSTTLKPGTITVQLLGKKALKGRLGVISLSDAHVHVDGCGGRVSMRLFAAVSTSTDRSDDGLNAYGNVTPL